LSARQTLATLGMPSTTYYRWYDRWSEGGLDALDDTAPHPGSMWNRLPDETRADIIEFALEYEDLTPRELAENLITAPAHIVMKAANEFKDMTTRPNELWQTDFTYLKVLRWGWFYLSTILDDYSRYIIAWKLCTTMKAGDVTTTLDLALAASGCDSATVLAKPRLLSDNGSSYIAGDLANYIEDKGMKHVRGAPYHPQTQGKIERWHQTMKNRVLLEHYFLPGELERQIEAFVEYYNNQRYHESLGNLTPADVYFGRDQQILKQREEIKRKTMRTRRLRHQSENA
jgi:transposase InsO family protein